MSRKWTMLVVTLIVLLMTMPLLAACDDDDDEEETKTVQPTKTVEPTETVITTETQVPMKEGKLTIGWLASFKGVAATQRDYSIDLAVKEINEAGGVQVGDTIYTFNLAIEGDQLTASGAIAGIQKLLYEKDSDIVVWGAVTPALVVLPYTEEEKVLLFDQNRPENMISPENPYSFMCISDPAIYELILLDWVSKNRPDIKTVAAVKQLQSLYEDTGEVHRKVVPGEYGIEFTGYEFFDATTRDFYPVLTKVLQGDHPDAIIVESNRGVMVVRQARDLGFEGTFLVAGDMPEHWAMLTPEERDGIISLTPPKDSPKVLQAYMDYLDAYYEMRSGLPYGYEVTFMNFYLVTYVYAAALKAAGSTDPDKVAEVMETQTLTIEFPGGEKLDVRFFGQEQFGANSYLIPTPEYLSVNLMDKPELMEVIEQDKLYEYRALYDRYRISE